MYFHFKKFSVKHKESAFKVGFDGILLGAWCDLCGDQSILDIGTGCGLIALIAAQKNSECRIDAIEPDMGSFEEAVINFSNTKWADRITAHNITLQKFSDITGFQYDHIISNPPFFIDALLPATAGNKISKHTLSLSHVQLIEYSYSLMVDNARLSIILPTTEGEKLIQESKKHGLQLSRLTRVISKSKSVRLLIELKKCESCVPELNELYVYNACEGYSNAYISLVKDLYLKL